MKVREFTSDEEQSCRENASRKIEIFAQKLVGLSDEEKFHACGDKFSKILHGLNRCAENFQRDEFVARGNEKLCPIELKTIFRGNVEGVYMLEELEAVMANISLSRINGTSLTFGIYSRTVESEKFRLVQARNVYEEGCPQSPISQPVNTPVLA